MRQALSAMILAICFIPALPAADDVAELLTNRNAAYQEELEQYFRNTLVNEYPQRAAELWNRNYYSPEAFLRSVAPNRARYRKMLAPPALNPTGPAKREPSALVTDVDAVWLTVPLGSLKAEGLLAVPQNASGPVPLIIAQHGIGSTPEKVFGVEDERNLYHDYGHVLLAEGFAVLAPLNLRNVEPRNRIERLARLGDTTLPGIEFARMQVLLDEALRDPRIDADRVGMWGISLGGMATMFWMPLEPRIDCGVVTAWFNHRRNKMVIPDERYSCFLETTEEHAFFRGWLTEFTDSDVASLLCPRPLLIQTGKKDGIAWWPQVMEEFKASSEHYEKLGVGGRIEIDLHEGGHEIRLESGLPFVKKWLKP
jgi:hypothetical protein